MGFFEKTMNVAKKAAMVMCNKIGMDNPNELCTEAYECEHCGMVRFFPESTDRVKRVSASESMPCLQGRKQHYLRKCN